MQCSPMPESQRADSSLRVMVEDEAPRTSQVEALSRQTEEAMDGFEEWLKEFKEELAEHGWPVDR